MAAFTASFEFRLQTEDAKKVFDLELCWFEYLIAFSPLLFFNQRFWLAFAMLHDWIAERHLFGSCAQDVIIYLCLSQGAMQCARCVCVMCIGMSHVLIVPLLSCFSEATKKEIT